MPWRLSVCCAGTQAGQRTTHGSSLAPCSPCTAPGVIQQCRCIRSVQRTAVGAMRNAVACCGWGSVDDRTVWRVSLLHCRAWQQSGRQGFCNTIGRGYIACLLAWCRQLWEALLWLICCNACAMSSQHCSSWCMSPRMDWYGSRPCPASVLVSLSYLSTEFGCCSSTFSAGSAYMHATP